MTGSPETSRSRKVICSDEYWLLDGVSSVIIMYEHLLCIALYRSIHIYLRIQVPFTTLPHGHWHLQALLGYINCDLVYIYRDGIKQYTVSAISGAGLSKCEP